MNEEKRETKIEEMAGDFSVLSNPTRLKLLMSIHEKGPCTLRELVEDSQRDESTIKRHIKELVDRGFIARSCGKKPKYYITDKGILAITFLRVKAEPTIVQDVAKLNEVKVKVRSRRPFSTLFYAIKKAGFKKIVLYSLSIICIFLGLSGLIASNVELLYRILWLLLWIVVAYVFKVLAS